VRTLLIGLVAAGAAAFLATAPASAAQRPESKAGVVSAIRSNPDEICGSPSNTEVTFYNSVGSVARGIADVAVNGTDGSCGRGCFEVWGYTGSTWSLLGACSNDAAIYPTTLASKILICKGNSNSILRSGPGASNKIVATIRANTRLAADRFRMQAPGRSGYFDGFGWYRVNWHGTYAWVASSRVTTASWGCAGWSKYWAHWKHA